MNCELSLSCLKGLLKRMRRKLSLLEEYNKSIKSQVENGIVEVVKNPTLVIGE
jgi:hypothetical protein